MPAASGGHNNPFSFSFFFALTHSLLSSLTSRTHILLYFASVYTQKSNDRSFCASATQGWLFLRLDNKMGLFTGPIKINWVDLEFIVIIHFWKDFTTFRFWMVVKNSWFDHQYRIDRLDRCCSNYFELCTSKNEILMFAHCLSFVYIDS